MRAFSGVKTKMRRKQPSGAAHALPSRGSRSRMKTSIWSKGPQRWRWGFVRFVFFFLRRSMLHTLEPCVKKKRKKPVNLRLWVKRSWFYSQFQKNTGTNQILHSLLTECQFLQFGCQLADLYIYPLLGAKAAALTAGFRLRSAKLAPIFNVAVHSWSCLVQNSNHRSLKKTPLRTLSCFITWTMAFILLSYKTLRVLWR